MYKEGFITLLETEKFLPGLNEEIIRIISYKRKEPLWMLNFRIKAYKIWIDMKEPHWLNCIYSKLDYNSYIYYTIPSNIFINKNKKNFNKLIHYLTKEVKITFKKLGIPIINKKNIAIDAIFDSISVKTTYSKKLLNKGIIFCSFNEAIKKYFYLIQKYISSVVSINDNFFASLNSAVVSDGTFIYISKGVNCPIELTTYFRINDSYSGQFERTLIIVDKNSYLSYIEGCSASMNKNYQLHAAVVEIIILDNAEVKYSTIQNWYSGKKKGGILNFVTKRALCLGYNSKMSWIQYETGSAITWKYPSIILKGNKSKGNFFSLNITNFYQQADTGTKIIHIGSNTKSNIHSKSIAIKKSINTYRSLVYINNKAKNIKNYTKCESILIGSKSSSHTFPSIKVFNNSATLNHEALLTNIEEEKIFFCKQRGLNINNAINIILNGFCIDIINKLPLEYSIEAKKLLELNLINI